MNSQQRAELNLKMERLVDGDRQAFEFVFNTTWPLVYRLARKTVMKEIDAEDIAQQALMKVFSRSQEFEKGRDALSWILGVTAFECRTLRQKYRRRKERLSHIEEFDQMAATDHAAEESLIKKNLISTIQEIISELSPQDQESILASLENIKKPEHSGATYRKRLQRAMDRLKEKWRDRHE